MEKIYIEDNQSQKQVKKKRSLQSKVSIGLSFVLAFVAMASIIAWGFNNTSYALPEGSTTSGLADTFTVNVSDWNYLVRGTTADYPVRLALDESGKYVYCIEADVNVVDNSTYTREANEITDQGLVYLLHYFYNYKVVDATNTEIDSKAEAWAKQTALYIYLHEIGDSKNTSRMTNEIVNKFKAEKELLAGDSTTPFYTNTNSIFRTCMVNSSEIAANERTLEKMVEKAKAIHNGTASWNAFSINVSKKSENITTVKKANSNDVEYYQTDVYTLTGSNTLKEAAISLDESAPKGTEIYFVGKDKAATAEELANVAPGTQFYVRIPGSSIGENETKEVKLLVDGSFNGIVAFGYSADGSQRLTKVGTVLMPKQTGVSFKITTSPDTGVSNAQSIYFVGLIILIAGVGIIYANVKPSKLQQQ